MRTPEAIYERLKSLPAPDIERAAKFVDQLQSQRTQDRIAILRRTAGTLRKEQADEIEELVKRDCECIDNPDWQS